MNSKDGNPPDEATEALDKPYLDRAELVWRPWRETRPGWDHDECMFCWDKFADARKPSAMHEGFCTLDEYHWICKRCAEEMASRYRFQFLTDTTLPTVREIRERFAIGEDSSPGEKLGRTSKAYDGSGHDRE